MNRFQVISVVFVLGLLSCKTVECGYGTVENDGKCVELNCAPGTVKTGGTCVIVIPDDKKVYDKIVEAKSPAEAAIIADETNEAEAKKRADAETKKQTIEVIQDVVDEKIASWQAEWTHATGTFGVSSAKGTVTDFEITDDMSIKASISVEFQFDYGKRLITRSCSSSDFCSGDFREGQNKAKVVMVLDKVGYDLVYSSHTVR